jgi:chemotaxis signal transduction protein
MTESLSEKELAALRSRANAYRHLPAAEAERATLGPFAIFRRGGRRFALTTAALDSVATCPRVNPIPGAPDWLSGLAQHRGRLLVVIDLQGGAARDGYIAELHHPQGPLALRFDELESIREVYSDEVDSRFPTEEASTLPACGVTADRVIVLDAARIHEQFRLSSDS